MEGGRQRWGKEGGRQGCRNCEGRIREGEKN